MITQAEREEWFRDPVTRDFVAKLLETREAAKENWARQNYFNKDSREETERLNLYALAGVEILDQVIEMVQENAPKQEGEG